MAKFIPIRINDADYGDERVVIEAKSWWHNGVADWAVPAWEEMGLGELAGDFPSREAAQEALSSAAKWLPDYGYEITS